VKLGLFPRRLFHDDLNFIFLLVIKLQSLNLYLGLICLALLYVGRGANVGFRSLLLKVEQSLLLLAGVVIACAEVQTLDVLGVSRQDVFFQTLRKRG
jgi:hypothetical protein